jgi:hypothetical protein
MSLVQKCDYFNVGQNEKSSNESFCDLLSRVAFFRSAVFLITSIALVLCASLSFAQQGAGPAQQGRNQPRPNGVLPQPTPQGDAKRMELEERRRLRQEIQRHGPDFRSKEMGTRPMPKWLRSSRFALCTGRPAA